MIKPGSLQAKEFFEQLSSDVTYAPDYKTEMARAEAYHDSLQISQDIREFMEERGQPVLINNLIQPTINGVLGMEAKTRTDYQVRADDDHGVELAEALNERLNEEVRICRVHRANSDAFKREVVGGLGWVETRRNPDPFGPDYIIEEVDWREVDYDWRSKHPDLSDCRWIKRDRLIDVDVVKANFPKHHALIDACLNGNGLKHLTIAASTFNTHPDLVGPYTTDLQSYFDESMGTYINHDRKQVRITQVQYRTPRRGWVLRAGKVKLEYDANNPIHRAAVETGRATVKPATYTVIRHQFYIGPHLLGDVPSPYSHNRFSLTPFWGFREGATRKPYGLVRNLMSAQDEVNFRRSMITWLLKARLIIKDDDATIESDEELSQKVARVDGVITLNPDRKSTKLGGKGFEIHTETGVASQQFQVMQDAMKQIQDLAGVYSAFLGQEGGAQSGIAINSLVEQATVTMSDLFDNYQFGRQQVGENLMSLIEEDIGEEETVVKAYLHDSRPTKTIVINQRGQDEQGRAVVSNRLTQLRKHVVLADIQSSPGYRAQQLQQLMELAATLPDQAKLVILEDILNLTELPKKNDIINKIKQALGLGVQVEDLTDEERKQYEQRQQQAQEELKMVMREREAVVSKDEASAEKTRADASLTKRKVKALDTEENLDVARTQEILSRINQMDLDHTLARNDASDKLERDIAQLLATL